MRRPHPFACVVLGIRGAAVFLLAALLIGASTKLPDPLAADSQGTELPILMYHSVLRDEKRSGKYIVSPHTIEEDLAYLSGHGYTAILPAELAGIVNRGGRLPEKPVIISLDDGYLNNLTYVLPLLEQYDMKAVIAVVGSYSEKFSEKPDPNPAYAHLTWADITLLADSGRVEIANHSYDMHRQSPRRGAKRKTHWWRMPAAHSRCSRNTAVFFPPPMPILMGISAPNRCRFCAKWVLPSSLPARRRSTESGTTPRCSFPSGASTGRAASPPKSL